MGMRAVPRATAVVMRVDTAMVMRVDIAMVMRVNIAIRVVFLEQCAQTFLHDRILWTTGAAVEPLADFLGCDRVSYGATDFYFQPGNQCRLTIVLLKRFHGQDSSLVKTFCFHFNRVPQTFSVDERNHA